VLEADEDLIKQRHIDREDTQTDKFKKSKRTKIQNILDNHKVTILKNNTKEEAQNNLKTILNTIEE
jgi:hypothetical protein